MSNLQRLNRQNQFGGGVSGPILRNKLFFYFGYEGTRRNESFLESNTALTKEARSGLFRFVRGSFTLPGSKGRARMAYSIG